MMAEIQDLCSISIDRLGRQDEGMGYFLILNRNHFAFCDWYWGAPPMCALKHEALDGDLHPWVPNHEISDLDLILVSR